MEQRRAVSAKIHNLQLSACRSVTRGCLGTEVKGQGGKCCGDTEDQAMACVTCCWITSGISDNQGNPSCSPACPPSLFPSPLPSAFCVLVSLPWAGPLQHCIPSVFPISRLSGPMASHIEDIQLLPCQSQEEPPES